MHWLLHGSLTPAVAEALTRHGHKPHAPADLSLDPAAAPADVLKAAADKQWDLVTNDHAMANALFGDDAAPFARTVVFLQLEGGDVEQDDAIDRLFDRYKRLSPRRLYTVTGTRVKVRQLPGA